MTDTNKFAVFEIELNGGMARKQLLNKANRMITPLSETTLYINYSPFERVLEVAFKGGRIYHYTGVEPEMWDEYKSVVERGNSSGTFVNQQIKPCYDFKEVE